ncbi:C1 family peptidase [Candidatus Oscillochloris fontis]|uniref:C1 family peptidase n=1 Tax=Candidatus Oscillochloris fontis TaxID=2496868 RepID=UPI00101B6BF9|nr:C1 family peptidase [Candidatus Oscillochloris fontis]
MSEHTLTPLNTIAGFDEALCKKLADQFWITSAEEFHSVVRSSNHQYGSGRKALAVALGMDEAQVKALADTVRATLPADTPFSIPADIEVGAGLLMDGLTDVEASSFATVVDLPDAVEPLTKQKSISPPHHQGKRNTCVAFSLASIMQILGDDPTDLSEQFLYYLCKEKDGIPGDVGTNPALAVQLLQSEGICTETTWPYHAEPDNSQPGGPKPPEPAYTEARRRRITGFTQIPAKGSAGVAQIQAQLAQGKPVMIGMPIYEHWSGSTQGTLLGRLRFPLPGERQAGGHAMCVVGYRSDATAPGGGYFIVRNSWGTDWAKDNPDGSGYCHMPYLLLARQNMVAFVVDGVVTETVVQEAPKAAGGKKMSNVRASARLGSSAEGGDSMMAIYADLLMIRDQVNSLAERLQALLGVDESENATEDAAVEPVTATAKAAAPVEEGGYKAPLVFINTGASEGSEELYPNGIDGNTGQPLLKIDAATAARLAQGLEPEPDEMKNLYKNKQIDASGGHFGTVADADQDKVEQARWAVVVNALESVEVLKNLWPLIRHRMQQMGYTKLDYDFQSSDANCGAWLNRHSDGGKKTLATAPNEVPPVLLVRPGERVNAWLARHGVAQGPVDPTRGVPFYLMIVARPGPINADDKVFIPLNFQYELDIFWGVGRLIFSDATGQHRLDDYKTYAERVVAWEQRKDAASQLSKEIAFFGTRHEEDTSTIRSADELIVPLVDWSKTSKIAVEKGVTQTVYLAEQATRSNLEKLLTATKSPALLFTASHGIGLPLSDNKLVMHQGALVTADFGGFGSIKRDHWMAGEDLDGLSKANVEGMIAFLFACYGAGCPHQDEFIFDANKKRPVIAPFPFIAQLPQRLLTKGALAVLGHVERAWTYSFSGTEAGTTRQVQPFQDVLGRLLQGKPAGSATDQFNVIQGARSMTLTEELEAITYGATVEPSVLSRLWMARNDARNYALLGDPAVKLAL